MKDLDYFIKMAEGMSERSTCLRRCYGSIIEKNWEIISVGYNTSPNGCITCKEKNFCFREQIKSKKGDYYTVCPSVHAEQMCLINANGKDLVNSTIYISGFERHIDNGKLIKVHADPTPCLICHRMLILAGVKKCFGIKDGEVIEIDISVENFEKRIEKEREKYNIV